MTERERAALLLALVLLGGCAPVVRVDAERLERAAPRSIAVLPFELVLGPGERDEDGALARRVEALRGAVTRRIALRHRTLPPGEADAALARAGLAPERSTRLAAARLAHALGVDAVVRGRVTTLDNVEGGVIFVHTITADLRMVDARGDVLAEVAHTERAIGGMLPESQQALRAILTTIENSTEAGYLRLAERFAEAVVRALPGPVQAGRPHPRPSIDSTWLQAAARPLVAGDEVVAELRGTPGLLAVLDLGPTSRGVPLDEVEPGVYRGNHRVGLGEAGAAVPAVRLRDAFGHGAWRALRTEPLVLAAQPLGAPGSARVSLGPTNQTARLSWRAVAGATSYRVFTLAADGRARLVATTARTFADVPPATRVAVAAVDDRGTVGAIAIGSVPEAGDSPRGAAVGGPEDDR